MMELAATTTARRARDAYEHDAGSGIASASPLLFAGAAPRDWPALALPPTSFQGKCPYLPFSLLMRC